MFASKFRSARYAAIFFACCTVGAAPAAPLAPPRPDSKAITSALAAAAADGLDPSPYRIANPQDENAIFQAALKYAQDLATGRPGLRQLDSDVALPPSDFDAAAILDRARRDGNLPAELQTLAPPYPEYAQLKKALAHYRGIAAASGWPQLDLNSTPDLVARRLGYEDPTANVSPIAEALARFQAHHGLVVDGRLGPATLAALNVPAAARADTIIANMERFRWLPRQREADRIVVNAADASLVLYLDNHNTLASRVIVGKPATPTPILRAEGAGITVNPAWTVPRSIAAKEFLPKLKRNPAWLAGQDMVLLDGPPGDPHGIHVNWRAVKPGTFPYQVRQAPGPKNPLGNIKLELPNRFDAYLHDTPGKSAFNAARRDVSHGCVRVEQILPLATYALNADPAAVEKLTGLIATGEPGYLPLKRKLPVYFLYWTAFADTDGQMEFRPDIYGRDKRMLAAIGRAALAADPARCDRS